MVIESDFIKITIKEDKTYTINSVDNKPYGIILNPFKYTRNDYTKTMEIVIQNELFEEVRIALVGSMYGYDSECAVLNDKEVIVLIYRDGIKIYDWNGTYYEIDLNGKLINEIDK